MWKSIKGYEGYYEVSDDGLVRSLNRVVPVENGGSKLISGRIMKLTRTCGRMGKGGYLVVNLRKNHTTKVIPVHRLVAETFLLNDKNLPTVNHIDGDKNNNNVNNLEWTSYADNNIHALHKGLRNPRSNYVCQFDDCGKFVRKYKSVSEAARITGISRGMISHCLHCRARYAGGYVWVKFDECNDYLDYESTTEDELPSEVQERT